MALPEIRYGMRPDANLFTRAEIGRYLRRFKMHLQAGSSDSLVNLACEIREEVEQRKNTDPDTVYLQSVIEDERLADTLEDRGILTVGDVLRAGNSAIRRIFRYEEKRFAPVFEACRKYSKTADYFE